MKKLCYLASLFLLFQCSDPEIRGGFSFVNSTKEVTATTYGGSKNDVYQSVVSTLDGGYAVLGYTQSKDFDIQDKTDESFDFLLMKFSSDHVLLWSKTYGGSDDDRAADLIATNDGGFALFGFSKSSDFDVDENAGAQDFWMIKTTFDGSISWEKTFGFSGADTGNALLQTADNGFLITGVLDVTASNGQGNSKTLERHAGGDVWAIKLNNNGDLVWSRYFGGSFTDVPFGVIETNANEYIIAASSDSEDFNISNNKGTYDYWLFKLSNTGELIWEKSFGGSEVEEPRGIAATDDGNFFVVGDTRSTDQDVSSNNGGADLWMIKISSDGNLIWDKNLGGSSFDVARSISKTQDGEFIISGNSRSLDSGFTNNGQNDAWVLKVDNNGNLLWQQFVGGSENELLFDAVALNNNQIIAVGESSSSDLDISENKGFSDGLIIHIK
ncbi:hypothetical protein [Polaribacter sp. P097]|uniref:hypothetical protein n=1 Tax=Polaribacter sp. P097 TaxID=3117398 RepID=UPI002FE3532D